MSENSTIVMGNVTELRQQVEALANIISDILNDDEGDLDHIMWNARRRLSQLVHEGILVPNVLLGEMR